MLVINPEWNSLLGMFVSLISKLQCFPTMSEPPEGHPSPKDIEMTISRGGYYQTANGGLSLSILYITILFDFLK